MTMDSDKPGKRLASDYDADPARFAANQLATARFTSRGDVHPGVAERFAEERYRDVLDIGGGNGRLARILGLHGIHAVVVDRSNLIAHAPRPAIRADAAKLPFRDSSFDGAAALWMLYHLAQPELALREASRVLRPGGLLAVCTSSRYNDPELASVLPSWGEPISFDAENGEAIIRQVFDDVETVRWDSPMVHLRDAEALGLFLRGRGLSRRDAHSVAERVRTPLVVTKRGMLAWARKGG